MFVFSSSESQEAVRRECDEICSSSKPSLFRKSSPDDLDKWSYSNQEAELQERAPVLLSILKTAATSTQNLKRTRNKDQTTIRPGIMAAASTLLNCRSNFMNLHGVMTAMILKRAGAKKDAFRRLNARFICSSYGTAHNRQIAFGKDFDKLVLEWQKKVSDEAFVEEAIQCGMIPNRTLEQYNRIRTPTYKIIFDNLDMRLLAHFMSVMKQNQDLHMCNMMAVQNRISAFELPDKTPLVEDISDVSPSMFLPNLEDEAALRKSWVIHIAHIISKYLPQLAWLNLHVPKHVPHQYMREAANKTPVVSISVYIKVPIVAFQSNPCMLLPAP